MMRPGQEAELAPDPCLQIGRVVKTARKTLHGCRGEGLHDGELEGRTGMGGSVNLGWWGEGATPGRFNEFIARQLARNPPDLRGI